MVCNGRAGWGAQDDLSGFSAGTKKSADTGRGDSVADFSLDAIRLKDALLIDRFTVMGHSFVGAIALKVAEIEPGRVAGVVLVDPTVPIAKGEQR